MNLELWIKRFIILILFILTVALLSYFAMQSDFAQISKKVDAARSYKMKTKYAKELVYSTKFRKNSSNDSILSLGDFTINLKSRKLIMKVSIESDEDTIDTIMEYQSVIRNDVINSATNTKNSAISQAKLAQNIKEKLNSRLKENAVKEVYFEKFLLQ